MAKVVSHIASSIRGSIAGITYLTTPSGAIVARQRVIPVNPSTGNQQKIRSALANVSFQWTTLTAAEREAWDNAAGVSTMLLGRSIIKPGNGRSLFTATGSFVNYLYAQGKIATVFDGVAPNTTGLPPMQITGLPYGGPTGSTGISFNVLNTHEGRSLKVFVWTGVQVNDSRGYYQGPWRPATIQSADIDEGSGANINVTYTPNPLEGQKLFVKVVPLWTPYGSYTGYVRGTPQIVFDNMQTAEA